MTEGEAAPAAASGSDKRNLAMRVAAAIVLIPLAVAIAYAGGWLWTALVTLAAIGLFAEWLAIVGLAGAMRVIVPGVAALVQKVAVPVLGVAGLDEPQLLQPSTMHRRRGRGDAVAGAGGSEEVGGVVDPDHPFGPAVALLGVPESGRDARRALVDQAVDAAVRDAERLQVLLGDGPLDHHAVAVGAGDPQVEELVQLQRVHIARP